MALAMTQLSIATLKNEKFICSRNLTPGALVPRQYVTDSKAEACCLLAVHSQRQRRKSFRLVCSLPETAASVAIAATVVGAAATVLMRRNKASEETEIPMKDCEDCGGTGICPECKGEGFVVKKQSDAKADRARMNAKNMATRYTAGLPKKWSYCTKCSSARSCNTCEGRGKLSY